MDKKLNLNAFHHKINIKVKFHEVDMMSVVNNAVYFNYFEDARIKYLQDLKAKYNLTELMTGDSFFIMAHNEADYLIPAKFDEDLAIFTKVEWIKNSSFSFKHIIQNEGNGKIIAIGGGIFVHIKLSTKEKQDLPESLVMAIQNFESEVQKIN